MSTGRASLGLAVALALALGSQISVAQDSRYSSDFGSPAVSAAAAPTGSDTADLVDELNGDGATHLVQFSRDTAGVPAVAIDGTEFVRVTNQGFRDAFDGIVLVNQGGDYAVASVKVFGG